MRANPINNTGEQRGAGGEGEIAYDRRRVRGRGMRAMTESRLAPLRMASVWINLARYFVRTSSAFFAPAAPCPGC